MRKRDNVVTEKDLEAAISDWPPPWVPGRPKPPRKHTKYCLTMERALQRVHPKLGRPERGNELWNRIMREHNADREFWLYDDSHRPKDTEEWEYIEENVMPKVLLALERTCSLEQQLEAADESDRVFNFAVSFVHFLMNEELKMNELEHPGVDDCEECLGRLKSEVIPKYKLMSRNKAAKIIQKHVRGWLVRKQPAIQEMRSFWKVATETDYKEVVRTNSRITFRNKAEKDYLPVEDFFLDCDVLDIVLGDDICNADTGVGFVKRNMKGMENRNPKPCLESLGVDDDSLDKLTKEELKELIRISSLQPDLKSDAIKKFFSRRNKNKP